jgi:hypothetical protein
MSEQARKIQSLHGVMFLVKQGLKVGIALLRRPDYQLSCFYKFSHILAEYHIS